MTHPLNCYKECIPYKFLRLFIHKNKIIKQFASPSMPSPRLSGLVVIDRNKWQWDGAKSGEYTGWGKTSEPKFSILSPSCFCSLALSWSKMTFRLPLPEKGRLKLQSFTWSSQLLRIKIRINCLFGFNRLILHTFWSQQTQCIAYFPWISRFGVKSEGSFRSSPCLSLTGLAQ